MERGKENEDQYEDNKSLVSSVVLREDIVYLVDFTERLKNWRVQTSLLHFSSQVLEKSTNHSEWKVDAEKSFPVLEKLFISGCDKLMEIPDSFGDIASLKFISVWFSPQLKESLFKIKEYVEEMTGEDKLHVEFFDRGS